MTKKGGLVRQKKVLQLTKKIWRTKSMLHKFYTPSFGLQCSPYYEPHSQYIWWMAISHVSGPGSHQDLESKEAALIFLSPGIVGDASLKRLVATAVHTHRPLSFSLILKKCELFYSFQSLLNAHRGNTRVVVLLWGFVVSGTSACCTGAVPNLWSRVKFTRCSKVQM